MWVTLFSPVMTNNSCSKLSVAKTPRLCDCHTEDVAVLSFFFNNELHYASGRTSVNIRLLHLLHSISVQISAWGLVLKAISFNVHLCVWPFYLIVLGLLKSALLRISALGTMKACSCLFIIFPNEVHFLTPDTHRAKENYAGLCLKYGQTPTTGFE